MDELTILYEDNHIIVVLKPQNIPTCEDESKDRDMLTIIKDYIREKYAKTGNVYLGLVHRLDRPTGGVMVFAKSSKAAARHIAVHGTADSVHLHANLMTSARVKSYVGKTKFAFLL